MSTIESLESAAQEARDKDREAIVNLIQVARNLVMTYREGGAMELLLVTLMQLVDAQRETAQARWIANEALQMEQAQQAVGS